MLRTKKTRDVRFYLLCFLQYAVSMVPKLFQTTENLGSREQEKLRWSCDFKEIRNMHKKSMALYTQDIHICSH